MKSGYIYILTNKNHSTLYTGITNNLLRRIHEHKEKQVDGFTKKYNCTLLVYYEYFENIELAIQREKQIKAGSREKKEILITSINPYWKDLSEKVKELV